MAKKEKNPNRFSLIYTDKCAMVGQYIVANLYLLYLSTLI